MHYFLKTFAILVNINNIKFVTILTYTTTGDVIPLSPTAAQEISNIYNKLFLEFSRKT